MPYTIGQLAKLAGVPTSTLRFYERKSLLRPENRSRGNYRTYSAKSAEKLKFIRAAQAGGFTLKDVRQMLALTDAQGAPCRDIVSLMQGRLDEVRARLRELRRIERTLARALKSCCRGGPDWCEEIERLKDEPSAECVAIRKKCGSETGNCESCLTLH
jgi:DNA-binding transcriptional MerR regulator